MKTKTAEKFLKKADVENIRINVWNNKGEYDNPFLSQLLDSYIKYRMPSDEKIETRFLTSRDEIIAQSNMPDGRIEAYIARNRDRQSGAKWLKQLLS